MTAGSLIKLLAAGKIRNAKITVQDVVRSVNIWGKDLANLKGKTTAKTLEREREIEAPMVELTRQDQILYIDLMFINQRVYLIGKANPSELIMIKKLKNNRKDVATIGSALLGMLNYMKRAGFSIVEIQCDTEAAVDTEGLRGIIGQELNTSGGESIKIIERLIRVIKERVRGIVNTVPYEMPDTLLDYLVYNIV